MNHIVSFITHRLKANSRHGTHSPFVYALVDECIYEDNKTKTAVSAHFKHLKKSDQLVSGTDFGRGGAMTRRTVGELARTSAMPDGQARLLARLAQYLGSNSILELGTNIGKSSANIAAVNPMAQIHTVEGNEGLAEFAAAQFDTLKQTNLHVHASTFDAFFEANATQFDFIFIDGDHSYEPTIRYTKKALEILKRGGVIVLHDIYWSDDMHRAWNEITQLPELTVTIDLYFFGLAFVRPEQAKEHFKIRFPKSILDLV